MAIIIANTATFDGNDITTVAGLTILSTNPYAPAKRKLNIFDLARVNKAKINSGFYTKKPITIRIAVSRATRDLLEQSIDTLNGMLQGLEKTLQVRQSGGLRNYTATYSDCVIHEEGGAYIEMSLIFETSDHFGYDTADTLLAQVSGFTSGQKTNQIIVGGSAQWQVPKITITLSALSGGTYITYGNDNTGQLVTITRTFSAGDVIEIDALNQSVKVNGVETAYTGAIPEFAIGTNYVTYSDNFTSRTMSYTMTYKKRYV